MTPHKYKLAEESNDRLKMLGKHLNDLKTLKTQEQLIHKLKDMALTKADIETLSAPLIAAAQVAFDAEQAVFDSL